MDYNINALLEEISTLPEFVNRRVAVDTAGIFGNRPLHVACTWQDIDAVDALLANGADINCIGESGETPIFRAVRGGKVEFVHQLLMRGAAVDIRNGDGLLPLDVAMLEGYPTIGALLQCESSLNGMAGHQFPKAGSDE